MEQRLSLITLGVGDLARSRRFYENGLGWRVDDAQEGILFFQLNGLILGLFPREELAKDANVANDRCGFAGIALTHCTHTIEEADEILVRARAAGGRILKWGQPMEWGGYSGYFADPDGHLWEVMQNPFWHVDRDGKTRLLGSDTHLDKHADH
jgi:uncharacterized protein